MVAGRNLPITGKTDTYCCLSLIGGTSQIEVQKHLIVDHNVSKLHGDEHFSKNSIQGGYKILYINPQNRTKNFKQSLAPEWKESFECTDSRTNIAASDQKSPENLLRTAASTSRLAGQDVLLLITVHNADSVGSDKYVGWVTIPLQQNTAADDWYFLKTREGNEQLGHSGLPSAVHVRAKYVYRKGPVLRPAGAKPRPSVVNIPLTPRESDAKFRAQPEKAIFEMPALTPKQQSGRAQNDKDSARRNSRSSLADSILSGGSDLLSPRGDFKLGANQEPLSVSQLSRSFLSPDPPPTAPTPSPDVHSPNSGLRSLELRSVDNVPEGMPAPKVVEGNGHSAAAESQEASRQEACGARRESLAMSKRSGQGGSVDADTVFQEIEAAHRLSLEAQQPPRPPPAPDSPPARPDLPPPPPHPRPPPNGAPVVEATVVKQSVEGAGQWRVVVSVVKLCSMPEDADAGRGAGGQGGGVFCCLSLLHAEAGGQLSSQLLVDHLPHPLPSGAEPVSEGAGGERRRVLVAQRVTSARKAEEERWDEQFTLTHTHPPRGAGEGAGEEGLAGQAALLLVTLHDALPSAASAASVSGQAAAAFAVVQMQAGEARECLAPLWRRQGVPLLGLSGEQAAVHLSFAYQTADARGLPPLLEPPSRRSEAGSRGSSRAASPLPGPGPPARTSPPPPPRASSRASPRGAPDRLKSPRDARGWSGRGGVDSGGRGGGSRTPRGRGGEWEGEEPAWTPPSFHYA